VKRASLLRQLRPSSSALPPVPWRNRAKAGTVNGTLMMSTEIRSLGLVVLAALLLLSLALLSNPAGAAKRKPREKLYSISLTTTVHAASTESVEGATPPFGCKGPSTETFRYSASGHTSPAPKKVPLSKHGRFRYFDFPGQLKGLSVSLTEDATNSWEYDPNVPFGPDDPSVCVVPPTHTVGHCQIDPEQRGFELFPNPGDGGKFTLIYEAPPIILECPPVNYAHPSGFFYPILTSLRLSSVLALRRHDSVRAEGRVSRPLIGRLTGGPIGTETVGYAIKITRAR
jgi:hypothetical protein